MRLWLMKIVDIDVEAVVEDSAGNSLVTAESLEQLNNSSLFHSLARYWNCLITAWS